MNNDEKRIQNLLQLINVSERRIILERSNIDKYKSELKSLKNIKNKKIFTKFAKSLLKNNKSNTKSRSTTKKTTTTKTKSATKKGRKKIVTVAIMKKALKTHNIKFTSKLKKNDLGALIKKHCLVRYCESQVKN